MIKDDGLDRVAALNDADIEFYQFLPLYDLIHLGRVLGRGHSPTSGEMTWALVNGCFVVADVLSLATVQPEGVAAAEAARGEIKAAAHQAAKSLGREAGEEAVEVGEKAVARKGSKSPPSSFPSGGPSASPAARFRCFAGFPRRLRSSALPRSPISASPSAPRRAFV